MVMSISMSDRKSSVVRQLTRLGIGVLPYLVSLALAVWSLRNVLATPGTIGHSWDWGDPAFPDQNLAPAQSFFWSWDDLIGGGNFNPLKSLYYVLMVFPLGNFGGEIQTKSLVVLLLWASAIGMYLLARKGLRLKMLWSTVAAVLYMLSPMTYSRLIAGYLALILAQALLPILVLLCLQIPQAAERGSLSLAWKTVAAGVLLGVNQAAHSSVFILAPLSVAVVFGLGLTRANVRKVLASGVIVFLLGLLLNISWITSFGVNYLSAGALFHGGGSEKPTDQITLASVTDWRQGVLDLVSQPMYESIRLNGANGVATEIEYPIPDSFASTWLFVSFVLPASVFALLLIRRELTPPILSLFVMGLFGVATVSGSRTILGESIFQFFRTFIPPAWAEFATTTRAFPLVALSYCALAPLALQHFSRRLFDWMNSIVLPVLARNVVVVALGMLLFAALAIWSVPFLSGDITRNTDKAIGLHFYTVQPEDRALYEFLRANPNQSRMTLIPPPGIWGVTDYGWVWGIGDLPPRPKFLAPSFNSAAWRSASDFSAYSPGSRAGKMLGLAAVEYVVFPFARLFDAATRPTYDAVLAAQPDLKPRATPFTQTAIFENQSYLPRVYAATAPTVVLGSSDLLAPLSTTPYFGKNPAIFFSTQQAMQDLDAVASHSPQFIAPFQTTTVTPSALITSSLGFAYRPVSIETRQIPGLSDPVTRLVSFGDTAVASTGTFSVSRGLDYVVRASAYAPTGKQIASGQPAFSELQDVLDETPTYSTWTKSSDASAGSENYSWATNTLFDTRAVEQGGLEIRAILGDPAVTVPYVELTRPIQPFTLEDYPILQVESQAQDPAVQFVEVHLGMDWNGDGVADTDWIIPIVPSAELKPSQIAVKDAAKLEFPDKPAYRVVSVTIRLTKRPKVDPQRVQPGLYSFGLKEISFRANSQPDSKANSFLPAEASTGALSAKSSESSVAIASTSDGLSLTFPVGDRETGLTLERSLPDVNTQDAPVFSVAYQVDGAATFNVDFRLSGLDAHGVSQVESLGTRQVAPFSRGTLVFTAPAQSALRAVRAEVAVSKLIGPPELRASIVTLTTFRVSRQTLVPYKDAQPPAPIVSIDGKRIALSPMPASEERTGIWFTSEAVSLGEGNHSIFAGYDDPSTPYRVGVVEIAPASAQPAAPVDAPAITFRQVNPTRYLVRVDNATAPFFLVFSEAYHAGWLAYLQDGRDRNDATWYEQSALLSWLLDGGRRTEIPEHALVNGYANSWYIDRIGSYNIVLEFSPQRLYEAGVFVSISTPIVCFLLLGIFWLKRRGSVRG